MHSLVQNHFIINLGFMVLLMVSGGGGGTEGGAYTRYQNFKIPHKHWFHGLKSTLILIKTLTLSSKKTPLLLSKHWHWMNRNTYFNLRFYNPLRQLLSPVTLGVTRRQSRVYFVDCKGIFTPPPYFVPGYKKVSFSNPPPPPPPPPPRRVPMVNPSVW